METRYRADATAPLLVVAGAVLWGTTGTSQALLGSGVDPSGVGGIRLVVATLALVLVAACRGPRSFAALPRRVPWVWLLAGGLGVSGYQLTFFAGVQRTGVAVGTLIMLATAPLVAGVLGTLLQGDIPGAAWAVGTAVALAGCALLVLGAGSSVRTDVVGVLASVAAGVFFGLYSVAARSVMSVTEDGVAATAWIFLAALPVVAVPLAGADLSWAASARSVLILAWLGLGATACAYLLYSCGLRRMAAAGASTLALAEPLTASLLSVVVLKEPLTPVSFAGIVLVLLGLGGVGAFSSRRRRPGRPAPVRRRTA